MYRHGWYQVAFEREISRDVTSACVGGVRLAVLRGPSGIRVVDAVCPHRGADLSIGGALAGDHIVCPFHGFLVGVGSASAQAFCARLYPSLVIGGLVFVRLSQDYDNGFADFMQRLVADSTIVPGFALKMRGTADLVIENAFDQAHFRPVHGIGLHGTFRLCEDGDGAVAVEGDFELPRAPVQRGLAMAENERVPFVARAYSPGIVASALGGVAPYGVITASTPTADGEAVIRLSLTMPRSVYGDKPKAEICDHLLRRSRSGLEKDRLVWDNMTAITPRYTRLDGPVQAFRAFCDRFAEPERA
jgi:nitrite reductase/ring-hydroxylating ferredoxin subunit